MRVALTSFGLLGLMAVAHGQYPLVRLMDPADGQQGVRTTVMTQDASGLLWLGSEQGLFRTDGDRTDRMFRIEGTSVTAICTGGGYVLAALSNGLIVRCDGSRCDTIHIDSRLLEAPARALLCRSDGEVWIGTYGDGVHVWKDGTIVRRLGIDQGLNDAHVNALASVLGGRVAIATDQGVAVVAADGSSLVKVTEETGAPDNLVLSLSADERGRVWAGTDRGGVFSFVPEHPQRITKLDTLWRGGPINSFATTDNRFWLGTSTGMVVCDTLAGMAYYRPRGEHQGAGSFVQVAMTAADGSVWWCDGSASLRRADPAVLITERHEGVPTTRVTAISNLSQGRIAFATSGAVFTHSEAFPDSEVFRRFILPTDSTTPIVSLSFASDGNLLAGTFGSGVFRIESERTWYRLIGTNENVLSMRTSGDHTWMATIGGLYSRDPAGVIKEVAIPGSRFAYDVLPMTDGSVFVATDGNGVIRVDRNGKATMLMEPTGTHRTFYALCEDAQGRVWTAGPGTGIHRVMDDGLTPLPKNDVLRMNDVYSLTRFGDVLLLFGDAGLLRVDPDKGNVNDLAQEYGLQGAQGELNAAMVDGKNNVWLATDRGLFRIDPRNQALDGTTLALLLTAMQGGERLPPDGEAELPASRDFISFRYTGLHYAAPEDLRFAYRLIGADSAVHYTLDREVSFTNLQPGDYRFDVAAFTALVPSGTEWVSYHFTVLRPWWLTRWAFATAIAVIVTILVVVIRVRESRLRLHERMEKDKARFQMEVLRSQVNPHFLFNSFNTLIELIEEAPSKAVSHVEQLSDFFREILQVRDKETIPLSDEMQLVKTYFSLEKRRFGERIQLDMQLTQEALQKHIPPLTVQLLVENALKHNVATDAEPLTVSLHATDETLTVTNPYRPRGAHTRSTGFGVESIRQRFAAITHRAASIGKENDNFVARIPLLSPHEDPDR